jgi:hypothetical protein
LGFDQCFPGSLSFQFITHAPLIRPHHASTVTIPQRLTSYRLSSHARYRLRIRLAILCPILHSPLSAPSSLLVVSPAVCLLTSSWTNGVAEELTEYVPFSLRLVQPLWASVTLLPCF